MQWGDLLRIKSEYPVRVWPKGVQAYHRWVRESIANAKPYDRFVREMLVSSGQLPGQSGERHRVNTKIHRPLPSSSPGLHGRRLSCSRCHASTEMDARRRPGHGRVLRPVASRIRQSGRRRSSTSIGRGLRNPKPSRWSRRSSSAARNWIWPAVRMPGAGSPTG